MKNYSLISFYKGISILFFDFPLIDQRGIRLFSFPRIQYYCGLHGLLQYNFGVLHGQANIFSGLCFGAGHHQRHCLRHRWRVDNKMTRAQPCFAVFSPAWSLLFCPVYSIITAWKRVLDLLEKVRYFLSDDKSLFVWA